MDQSPSVRGDAESGENPTVAQLEKLIGDLAQDDGSQEALMREHLMAARSYLLGAMPDEYELNLKLAQGVLPDIRNEDLRDRLKAFLYNQPTGNVGPYTAQ